MPVIFDPTKVYSLAGPFISTEPVLIALRVPDLNANSKSSAMSFRHMYRSPLLIISGLKP